MKKITFLFFLVGTFSWVNAQVLNQNAGWPNPAWTVTGSYNTDPLAFESDPTTTTNFAFDDDDAGSGHEDNIAAESPLINLTPAFTAGETWLTVTVQYGYHYFANDRLRFEYWDAGSSAWVAWGSNIAGNDTTVQDNYCTITKTAYTTSILNIAGFSPTQLSGFKYRISYDDDPAGIDWNWGFCFDSPTITSSTPPSCPAPIALTAVASGHSAILSWTETGSATLYNVEYGASGFTQGTGTLISGVSNSYNLTSLTPITAYSYYVQAACGGAAGVSTWVGPYSFTTSIGNDNFVDAQAISCGNTITGNTSSATLDEDSAPDGFGADMDAPNVWYSFTGTGSAETVTLDLCGSSYDTSVLVYTGTSGNLTLVAANDDDNTCVSNTVNSKVAFDSDGTTTYYIAVEGWNSGNVGAFTMSVTCSAVNPPAVNNQDCATALDIAVDGNDNNSDNSYGTVSSTQPSCDLFGSIQDVWFSFTAPASGLVTALLTPGTMTSLNYVMYSGACGALTAVGNCTSNQTAAASQSYTGLTPGNTYYIQVWSNGSEQGTFTLRLTDDGLGTNDFNSSNFAYYPNPVKNILNLSYNQEISNVEIFNLLGQKVISNTINANDAHIDMSSLSKGAYMVRVTSNNQVKTIKVIKE